MLTASQPVPGARRISSPMTSLYKKLFPVFWIVIVALMVAELVYLNLYALNKPPILVDLIPVMMAVMGVIIMRWLIGNLNDQVWDAGNRLIVVNRGQTRDIPLSAIVNVSHTTFTNPLCIRLTVKGADRAFDELMFCPVRSYGDYINPMRNSVSDDLVRRIHEPSHV